MLTHLHISNFAIVRALEIEWAAGMTTITGETGAGKSISLDALALCLGERADGLAVRPGADKADLVATFDVSRLPAAQQWLSEQDLSMGPECIIRRVIGPEGRSLGYINGVQVPAQQLRALGQHLLSIHGQHAHQLLLKAEQQKQLLDAYAGHHELYGRCRSQWKLVQQLRTEYQALQQSQQQREAQRQLLEYQVAELDQFAPQADEFVQLEQEHQRLSHASSLIETSQQALQLLYEQEDANAFAMLRQASHLLADAAHHDSALATLGQMVDEALVQIEEASRELRRYGDRVEIDPERLAEIDQRMTLWLSLSRKHQIAPDTLHLHHQLLSQQFSALAGDDSRLQELEMQIQQALRQYAELATQLSESRQAAAIDLSEKIARIMAELSMHNARFHIDVQPQLLEKASSSGWDQIEFLVSTNPGQPLQALHKVASGGELSRISLAIQVILTERVTTPTLIFDEVDVGISGPVAASVGRLLRQLGANTQLICVTHLPQVASQGHQQMFVEKYTDGVHTETRMRLLDDDARVQEIARLLAGENVSQHAIANARELLCAP
jgi:DNA repair protein RecN (Recombination protein N)